MFLFYKTPCVKFYQKFLIEENSVKIAAVSFTAPQSHVECTTEANQIVNEENIDMDLRILCLKRHSHANYIITNI